jgi:hypothetical protein
VQDISVVSGLSSTTTTSGGGAATAVTTQLFDFPLTMDINEVVLANGNINQTTKTIQNYQFAVKTVQKNVVTFTSSLVNSGQHSDTLELDSSFNLLGNTGQSSSQQYNYYDSTNAAYVCDLAAVANVLTSFSSGCAQ